MNTKHTYLTLFVLLILSVLAAAYIAPSLPDQIVSHWNAAGEPNGYSTKWEMLVFMPMTLLILIALSIIIPYIDPLKKNIAGFRSIYNLIWVLIGVFFSYIFAISIAWNLGYRFNFLFLLIPGIAVFWFALGVLLSKAKRNWFVGVRTPWTLSSDTVWEKTHRLVGLLFKLSGIIALGGLFVPKPSVAYAFIIAPIALSALVGVVYSYIAYRSEHGGE